MPISVALKKHADKGQPLGALSTPAIESAVKWATEKAKFGEFVTAGEMELRARVGGYDEPQREPDEDDLPF